MDCLVTGANGHLGFNLVQTLLARGHRVRAGLRSLSEPAKLAPVQALGPIELVAAEVRNSAQMRRALEGVDCFFHVAAVYSLAEAGREQEILDAALGGTEVSLRAAAAAGVRQVVMTSSTVTLPLTAPGAPPVDESHWTEDLRVPYFRAKTESERLAWSLAKELGLRLATILPAGIIGPGFQRNTPTINLVQAAWMGLFRAGVPDGNFGFVDVRDVADAHVRAAEQGANGRFIVCYDRQPSFKELVQALGRVDRKVRPPLLQMPRFVGPVLPLYDAAFHRLFGTPRTATPELIASAVSGRRWNYRSTRAQAELGWQAQQGFEDSLADTLAVLRQR